MTFTFNGNNIKEPLPLEEQKKYLELIKKYNDPKAIEKIFEHNIRLVVKVINTYYASYPDREKEDLFSEGCVGLYKSILEFDDSFECVFSTFAVPKIRGEITRFIRNNNLLHIPIPIQELAKNIKNVQNEYSNQQLSSEQLAKILNVTEEDILLALATNDQIYSLSQPYSPNSEDREKSLGDVIPDSKSTIYENIEQQEYYSDFVKTLDKLTQNERNIIKLFFGIECSPITIDEIANKLNISKYRCITDKENAIKKLKSLLPQYIMDEYQSCGIIATQSRKKSKSPNDLYKLYPEYTEQQILQAIDLLNIECKRVLELRFGLNGKEAMNMDEIAKIFNTKYGRINARVVYSKKVLPELLKIVKGSEHSPHTIKNVNNIFSFYPEYSKEQILEAINNLSDINKKIVELRFGLNGHDAMNNKGIAKLLNLNTNIVHRKLTDSKKMIKKILIKTTQKTKDIFMLFPKYSKEQILEAISRLGDKNKKIIELRFGLNGNTHAEVKEIAKIMNMQEVNVHSCISSSKKRIAYLLENPQKKKTTNSTKYKKKNQAIFELYPEYSDEEVLKALNSLNDQNIRIVELKFGLNGNEPTSNKKIANILNIDPNKIGYQVRDIKNKIARILSKTNRKETVTKPTESIEGTIVTDEEKINGDQPFEDNKDKFKMLINMLDDPKEQMVLLLRLGFIQNKNYTKAEIGKFLGMNEKEVQNITEKALANIHILASLTSKSIEQAEQQLKLINNN